METGQTSTPPGSRFHWLSDVPVNFRAALALAVGFMAFVAWDQSHWWRTKEDYAFGWLVPVFVVFVIYDRWPRLRSGLRSAAAVPVAPAGVRWVLNTLATGALLGGAGMFLLGAFYRAGAGISQPGTFAITTGMAAIVLALLFFNAPGAGGQAGSAASQGRNRGLVAGFAEEPRLRIALMFLFPVCVWIISAPIVSAIESQLSVFLRHKVAGAVTFTFEMLGWTLEQQGNVLVLPNGGRVGVEDACSGIRSLTACLFAGAFLSAVFLDRAWKKIALVVASMFFAFVTNIGRGLFLTGWAYFSADGSISETVHDVAGYAVLGLTCGGLLALVPLLNARIESAPARGEKTDAA